MSGLSAFTEYFVICTGYSTPQLQAICTEIEEVLYRGHEAGTGAPLGGMGAAGFRRVHRARAW
jgi:Ribosomal silencing factor during starvation